MNYHKNNIYQQLHYNHNPIYIHMLTFLFYPYNSGQEHNCGTSDANYAHPILWLGLQKDEVAAVVVAGGSFILLLHAVSGSTS